jgi:hypothetical protein
LDAGDNDQFYEVYSFFLIFGMQRMNFLSFGFNAHTQYHTDFETQILFLGSNGLFLPYLLPLNVTTDLESDLIGGLFGCEDAT